MKNRQKYIRIATIAAFCLLLGITGIRFQQGVPENPIEEAEAASAMFTSAKDLLYDEDILSEIDNANISAKLRNRLMSRSKKRMTTNPRKKMNNPKIKEMKKKTKRILRTILHREKFWMMGTLGTAAGSICQRGLWTFHRF